MKRYHFPLRPVGVLRGHQEMRAREVFAAAVHEYVAAEEALAGIRERKARLAAILTESLHGAYLAADAASAFQAYRHECGEEIKAEQATIAAREKMNAKRELYAAAHRALKGIQRLEERSREAYRREYDRTAQAELDDFANHRYLRRQTELAR